MEDKARRLQQLVKDTDSVVAGIRIPPIPRTQVSSACHDLALEHALSISILASYQLYGSAFALLRLLFEASIRGTWLYRCASDAQLNRYLNGDKLEVAVRDMVTSIEKQLGPNATQLSTLVENSWKTMNSFTHTGLAQVSRRFNGATMEGTFTSEDVQRLLNCAGVLCLLSGVELSNIVDSPERATRVLELSQAFAQT